MAEVASNSPDNDNIWLYVGGGLMLLVLVFFFLKKRNNTNPFKNIPGPQSSSAEWIAWHKALLSEGVEKAEANRQFLVAFNKYGADKGIANDNNLRTYTRTQGFEVPSYSVASGVYDTAVDTGKALDSGIGGIGMFFTIGVIIVTAMAGFVVYKIVKD